MHLYQYLPGKYKSAANSPAKKKVDAEKLDTLDLTSSTKSSFFTPKHKNVGVVKAHNYANPNPPPKLNSFPTKPQQQPSKQGKGSSLPINVGPDESEISVVSDVTTPTVLTCPKIGPGYSDSLSVTSDLTTPTVMPGGTPLFKPEGKRMHQPTSMLNVGRAQSVPRQRSRRVSFQNGCKKGGSGRRSKKHQKNSSAEPDKDLQNRLDRLRVKSIERINVGKSPKNSPRRLSLAASVPARLDLQEAQTAPSSTPKKMQDVMWNNLQHMMEKNIRIESLPRLKQNYQSSSPPKRERRRRRSAGNIKRKATVVSQGS